MLNGAQVDAPPPQDLVAEQSVLGGMMLSKDAIADVVEVLTPNDFYRPAHQAVYDCVLDLYGRGEPADPITVSAELERRGELGRVGGAPYLHTLIATVPTAANASYYAEIVAEKAVLRRLVEAGTRIKQQAGTPGADPAELLVQHQAAIAAIATRTPSGKHGGRRLVLTPASSIPIRRVRWLWDTTPVGADPTSEGRMPADSLTIAAGNPGTGKSQFGAWLAARITTGTLPGELWQQPSSVIYATTEDSWTQTVAPRLIAAGADLDRVYRVDVATDNAPAARLTLPTDTHLIGEVAKDHGVVAFMLDPFLSHISATINDYRAAEVRAAVEPLVAAAEQYRFAILGLAHFTKNGAADPLNRIAGSGAFGQLIRCLLAFAKQEDTDDGRRQFVCSVEKNNLGRTDMSGFAYGIEPVAVDASDGTSHVSRFVLGERTAETVASVMEEEQRPGSRDERNAAVEWLRDHLIDAGGRDTIANISTAAHKVKITRSPLYRAKKTLRLIGEQAGYGANKQSCWSLPQEVSRD